MYYCRRLWRLRWGWLCEFRVCGTRRGIGGGLYGKLSWSIFDSIDSSSPWYLKPSISIISYFYSTFHFFFDISTSADSPLREYHEPWSTQRKERVHLTRPRQVPNSLKACVWQLYFPNHRHVLLLLPFSLHVSRCLYACDSR